MNLAAAGEVFTVFLKLGLTSFGGPVAHLGYFREELVARRHWLDDRAYAELVALCQLLPGPASSQVGIAIGLLRAGYAGAVAAWIGFTLPSALAMLAFAALVTSLAPAGDAGWLHGLKAAAVAVVALAVAGMARSLLPGRLAPALVVAGAAVALAWPGAPGQVAAIAGGAAAGAILLRGKAEAPAPLPIAVGWPVALAMLALFAALLVGLPLLAAATGDPAVRLVDGFYRAGALVFGGGHVVLPLLQADFVAGGQVDGDLFVAGYGAAQALPGPLFAFAAYLGAVLSVPPNGVAGGLLAVAAIYLPSFLLVVGALPVWRAVRGHPAAAGGLSGINAAVIGLLAAALYDPVFTAGIRGPADFVIALAAGILLAAWKMPPWLVVLLAAAAGAALGFVAPMTG